MYPHLCRLRLNISSNMKVVTIARRILWVRRHFSSHRGREPGDQTVVLKVTSSVRPVSKTMPTRQPVQPAPRTGSPGILLLGDTCLCPAAGRCPWAWLPLWLALDTLWIRLSLLVASSHQGQLVHRGPMVGLDPLESFLPVLHLDDADFLDQ